MSAESIELELNPHQEHSTQGIPAHQESIEPDSSNEGFSLPPTDGGKDAWLFLLACFMLEGLIWGFGASYGIFQEYYSTNEPFAGSSGIAVVGSCALGMMYLGIAFIFAFLKGFPQLRIWATPFGLVLMCLSLGLGSFSTSVVHLIITQGIFFAIGGGLAWTPILFFIEEWWVRRRGFAYGTVMAGMGLSGAVLPVVLEWLLNSYGFRTTLRISALVLAALSFPVLLFFKPRLPSSQTSQSRRFDLSFWRSSTFLILQSGNIFTSLGYFLPTIYLPTYARSLGASNWESIGTVVLLNAAAFVGSFCMGLAVDRYHVTNCLFVGAVGSTVAVFLVWGLSTSLAPLYVFCLIYGAFAGSNASSWSAIIRETKQKNERADSGMIFGCLSFGKGIANLCSGPLSEKLLHAGEWKAGMAYGGGYGALIVFAGVTALLGGWSSAARRFGWL